VREIKGRLTAPLLLFLVIVGSLYCLHPRLGIRDVDAFNYLIGAKSLSKGLGYQLLDGTPITPWPKGYSTILSFFDDPIVAAQSINYLSAGTASALMLALLCRAGWTVGTALCASLIIAFGFFRIMATNATPDMLTYALFLGAVTLRSNQSRRRLLLSDILLLWAIPLKALAVLFYPLSLVFYFRPLRLIWLPLWGVAAAFSARGYMDHFVTYFSSQEAAKTSLQQRFDLLWDSLYSIGREGLFSWYGSIRSYPLLIASGVICIFGFFCLISLTRKSPFTRRAYFSLTYLACLFSLPLLFGMWVVLRHTGYGLLLLLSTRIPQTIRTSPWPYLAILAVGFAITNALTVNSNGANQPEYIQLAREASVLPLVKPKLPTNSYRILDLFAGIPTEPIGSEEEMQSANYYLQVSLPNLDVIATIVKPVELSSGRWCQKRVLNGAKFLERCDAMDK